MALVTGSVVSAAASCIPISAVTAALQVALRLAPRASVLQLGYSLDADELNFWVVIGTEDLKETEEIFRAAHSVQRENASAPVIRLHVIPEKQSYQGTLPPYEVIYNRA